jgi:acyl-coenzyme A synthetase/AMP-(fatty) acid ligase
MLANTVGPTAVTQTSESLTVHVATTGDAATDEALVEAILARLRERFTLSPNGYRARIVPAIPRTERGKIDYQALESQA